jgi:coenzyme F420 hydrogenase subunit beta
VSPPAGRTTALERLRRVAERDLCTRCGTCVGLGGGRIRFRDELGECVPEIPPELDPLLAERLWNGCSGEEVDFPGLTRHAFGEGAERHPYVGHFVRMYVGQCTDMAIRREAASGGLLTTALVHLLETGRIDGAVTVAMDPREPFRTRPVIARTREEVLAAAGSKYGITAVNSLLSEMERFEGRLAYVGLPCQVHSIRKLQAAGDPAVDSIEYVLGPFCGNTLHFSSVRSFLRSNGVRDYHEVKELGYREGEWPGNMRVVLEGGRVIELPKFHANYLIPFHIMRRCLLCTDLANEFADLSGGDAWAPRYEERGEGYSFVVARSSRGMELLDELVEAGKLELTPVTIEDALEMHSHGYDLKKRGAFIRIARRVARGKPVPRYGYTLPRPPARRLFFESVLGCLFWICRRRFVQWMVEKVPQKLLGWIFVFARTAWKRMTRSVKRGRLGET